MSQGAGPAYVQAISSSLVDVGTLKIVYRAVNGSGGFVPVVAQTTMPALPPGDYRLQTYYRIDNNGFLDPEIAGDALDFRVEPSAQTGCHPWTVAPQRSTVQDAVVGTPFAAPLSVVVRDDRNAPVQGAHVRFQRVSATSGADAALSDTFVVTDMQGRASAAATANAVEGSYAYAASVTHANVTSTGYFTLRDRTAADLAGLPAVVEYFHALRSHYFMTSDAQG